MLKLPIDELVESAGYVSSGGRSAFIFVVPVLVPGSAFLVREGEVEVLDEARRDSPRALIRVTDGRREIAQRAEPPSGEQPERLARLGQGGIRARGRRRIRVLRLRRVEEAYVSIDGRRQGDGGGRADQLAGFGRPGS